MLCVWLSMPAASATSPGCCGRSRVLIVLPDGCSPSGALRLQLRESQAHKKQLGASFFGRAQDEKLFLLSCAVVAPVYLLQESTQESNHTRKRHAMQTAARTTQANFLVRLCLVPGVWDPLCCCQCVCTTTHGAVRRLMNTFSVDGRVDQSTDPST